MQIDTNTSSLCFDDILLVPKKSNVISRSNIEFKSIIGNPNNQAAWLYLDNAFVMAPMEFISSTAMIKKVLEYGGLAFVQRFQPKENRIAQYKNLVIESNWTHRLGFSINNKEAEDKNFIDEILSMGCKIILIDTPYGHTDMSVNAVKRLRTMIPNYIHIMSGNVSSYEAYKDLMDAGADSVRVGIGGGAACTTRIVTGFGTPVLGSIMDIYQNVKFDDVNGIVSDGGIKNNGDIVKALAGGASAVMMGTAFAGHEECDGAKDGKFLFRGLASEGIQIDKDTGQRPPLNALHIEGVSAYLENKGPVELTIAQIINNVKSGMSYCGSETLKSFREECRFIKVSPQSLKESGSRI
jgi:IMP dehydrogenase